MTGSDESSWQASFPHAPAIAQITLSTIQLHVSVSEADNFHAARNDGFSSSIYYTLHKQKCLNSIHFKFLCLSCFLRVFCSLIAGVL